MATYPNHKKDRIALSYKPYKNICDVIIEGCFTGKLVSILTSEYSFNPHPLLYLSIGSVECAKSL